MHVLVTCIARKHPNESEESCLQKLRALRGIINGHEQELVQSSTVKGLSLGLRSAEYHRALNAQQMQGVVDHFKLKDDEPLLLYAALIAMWTQEQLIKFRVPHQETWNVLLMLGDHVVEWLRQNDEFMRRKGVLEMPWMIENQFAAELAAAMEAYDNGVMVMMSANYVPDAALKEHWQQLALFHFVRAANQLDHITPTPQQDAEWRWWRQATQQEIDRLVKLGASLPQLIPWP